MGRLTIKPCNKCGKTPELVKNWHDKHNRSFNHLPYELSCGCSTARGGSRREVIELHNEMLEVEAYIEATPVPKAAWWVRLFKWMGLD